MTDLPDLAQQPLPAREPKHPVDAAVDKLIMELADFRAHRISGPYPDWSDKVKMKQEIEVLTKKFDRVFEAIVLYAQEHYGRINQSLFTDCVWGAFDGQATHEIESAALRYKEDFAA